VTIAWAEVRRRPVEVQSGQLAGLPLSPYCI
jgi:hypothetical protein